MTESNNTRDIMDLSTPTSETAESSSRPTVERDTGRDFLDTFLEEEPPIEKTIEEPAVKMASTPTVKGWPDGIEEGDIQGGIIAKLKNVFDPEIPVNIYEMGLIYEVNVGDDGDVEIKMTLTSPHCPVAETMPGEVERQAWSIPGVKSVDVKLVWEPMWDMSRMSDEARLELGLL